LIFAGNLIALISIWVIACNFYNLLGFVMKNLFSILNYFFIMALMTITFSVRGADDAYINSFIDRMKTEKIEYRDRELSIFGVDTFESHKKGLLVGSGALAVATIVALFSNAKAIERILSCGALASVGSIIIGWELCSYFKSKGIPLVRMNERGIQQQNGFIRWPDIAAIGLVQYLFNDLSKNSRRMEGQSIQCYDVHGHTLFSAHEHDLPMTGRNIMVLLEHYLVSANVKYIRRAEQVIRI
jgi:hypothetical protein